MNNAHKRTVAAGGDRESRYGQTAEQHYHGQKYC